MTRPGLQPMSWESEAWERRRRGLSHDWLKDPRNLLAKWRNVLAGRVIDPSFDAAVAVAALRAWETYGSRECRELAASFVSEMSPRVLFDRPPLASCLPEIRSWLLPLTHELWLARTGVQEAVRRLNAATGETDVEYNSLVALASFSEQAVDNEALGQSVARLQSAFAELSNALVAFPHRTRLL